jgi:hypothetical protein
LLPEAAAWEYTTDCGEQLRIGDDIQNARSFSTLVARNYEGDEEGDGLFVSVFEGDE